MLPLLLNQAMHCTCVQWKQFIKLAVIMRAYIVLIGTKFQDFDCLLAVV